MSDTVFVIHGVANRDEAGFRNEVAALSEAMGGRFDLKPVYWGDLGADDKWVHLTIPGRSGTDGDEVRDTEQPGAELTAALFGTSASAELRDDTGTGALALFTAAALEGLGAGGSEEIRDEDLPVDEVTEAIAEQWPQTTWLRVVTDENLLREVGLVVTAPLADGDEAGGEEVREEPIRGVDVIGYVKWRIVDVDRVLGAAFSAVGGGLNSFLRVQLLPALTRFLGDVLVYQRKRAEIHRRVWSVIEAVDPQLGHDQEHPVRIVGHSLGGVIVVDMATSDSPLWTSSLVTFGSQSPFFHVCDPRGGQLLPFQGQELVTLPKSVRAWTNLWEPMDMLAFAAAKVFRLADGSAPFDLPVDHLVSSGLWTHSVYWRLESVAIAIGKALTAAEARP